MANYYTFVAFVILLSLTDGAPQMQRHRRHRLWPLDEAYSTKLEWVNPCGENMAINFDTMPDNPATMNRPRIRKPLKPLREAIPNFVLRSNSPSMTAIDTSDVPEWFRFNSTYSFLHQISPNASNISLRKWHVDTQVYVGAFQYLFDKQTKHDSVRNEGNGKSYELRELLVLAKNLLCEIETAINNTGLLMPHVISRKIMNQKLTFRNNNRDRTRFPEIDDLDSKFTKVRLNEYLNGLQRVMKRTGKKHLRHKQMKQRRQWKNMRKNVTGKRNVADEISGNSTVLITNNNILNKNNTIGRQRNGNGMRRNHNNITDNTTIMRPRHRFRAGERRNRNQMPLNNNGNGLNDIRFERRYRKRRTTTTPSTPLLQ